MFKKKRKYEDYAVAILVENELSQVEYNKLAEPFSDEIGVGVVSEIKVGHYVKEWEVLQRKFPEQQPTSFPRFVILRVHEDKVNQAIKEMERKNWWDWLFNAIHPEEYMIAEDKVMYDYENAEFYTDKFEEAVEYLNNK
ncbi:hypothetical protein FZC76_04435 [Sutcliffiella horikoshii]|uniref:Uncharacterized protein n=1 Tax=Sutcliffiella horikoshii TaxID=79883 RepID=A0A5D4T1C2_9BACI|nr:hypothetical protein [Sutcliffiella horikoshii]TYS69490.1 hypothetical protein FZC76_04435 [Sutcliffiella horikoshii]